MNLGKTETSNKLMVDACFIQIALKYKGRKGK